MRLIQLNCQHNYAVCQATFQVGVEIEADFICLQEPYVGMRGMSHPAYDFVMGNAGETRQQRVAFGIKKDIRANVIVETRSDLVDHPYIQIIDIWELDLCGNKSRKTRIINLYDDWVGDGYQWRGDKDGKRRAIEDVSWDKVIEKRTKLVGDFNAHSPYWNSLCRRRIRADQLESIIDRHKLLVNNEMTTPTRLKQTSGCFIIDLTMSTPDLGYLPV